MVDPKQLESQLTEAIQLAQEMPEQAKPISIWDTYYQKISQLPGWQQLLISGEALNQLAEVTRLKSDCYFGLSDDDIAETLSEAEGVTLDEDWLDGLIRKTSSLDLSRFEKPDTRFRLPGEDFWDGDDEVEGDAVAAEEIIDSPESLEQALEIAHVESASDWQALIHSILSLEPGPIDFWALKQKTGLAPVALFLGLMLGSDKWALVQEDFSVDDGYDATLSICLY